MKTIISRIALIGAVSACALSCNVLDREPLDAASPDKFYSNVEQLTSFTINYYPTVFARPLHNWGAGIASWDNGTDNQAGSNPNRGMFHLDHWKVASTGGLGFEAIRNVNWFLADVTKKRKEGKISGTDAAIDQIFGEARFIRAMLYFGKLKDFGDYPLVTEPLDEDNDKLIAAAKRMPRNEVARFILSELDEAIKLLPENADNNQRITKKVGHMAKSRVALYEGTFELYHRGSGRVPGDPTWPGKGKEWNKGKNFNQEEEVRFFLDVAMKSSKIVADNIQLTQNSGVVVPNGIRGWNAYYDMFASRSLSGVSEVLLWSEYNRDRGLMHNTTNRLRGGGNTGWTRGLVESFLMQNGLPIYAQGSGYAEDVTLKDVKKDRDLRLQLFLNDEDSPLSVTGAEDKFISPYLLGKAETRDVTGYRQRKFFSLDPADDQTGGQSDMSATIIYRGAEAMLNYIEASYLVNKSLDADATKYWMALRKRAGITADIDKTIAATKMSVEADVNRPSYDWAAFSAGQPVDATLYSIRRERRSEFAGEGMRMDDLIRWRAMDQVKNYQIEGINLWDKIYTYPQRNNAGKFEKAKFVADGGKDANVSSNKLSKYLRPYQIIEKNNDIFNGYTFYQAHYLAPFSIREIELASPTNDVNNSNLYQNPGWPTVANKSAIVN